MEAWTSSPLHNWASGAKFKLRHQLLALGGDKGVSTVICAMFGRAYLPRLFVEGVSRSAARCGITPHLRLGSWLAQRQTQALELVPLAALLGKTALQMVVSSADGLCGKTAKL